MPRVTRTILAAALVLAVLAATARAAGPLPSVRLTSGLYVIEAEVARTPETRTRGLMFRQSMPANRGMLFVFPHAERQCFWMKNTLIPLSIAFLDDRGAIVNIADMQPQSEDLHCSARAVRYALEMNQGWFAAKRIGPGAVVNGIARAADLP
ncbi:MAG: DUF192 domain-containing protein [Burkholderiales bacterium]|nr:DUF192 domain-containing protein [Burkholderiales bacterium]